MGFHGLTLFLKVDNFIFLSIMFVLRTVRWIGSENFLNKSQQKNLVVVYKTTTFCVRPL